MKEGKKSNLFMVFIPIILIVAILLIIPSSNKEVKISKELLILENDIYFISFLAKNITEGILQAELEANISYPLMHGKGGRTWEIAGRKHFHIYLNPKEQKQFRERLDFMLPLKAALLEFRELVPTIRVLKVTEIPE